MHATTLPDIDLPRQRAVADAFLAAARAGDFDALLAVLDPDVVLRADDGSRSAASGRIRGARNVAKAALAYSRLAQYARPALINGAPGLVTTRGGPPVSVLAFTIRGGRIVEIDILADPSRLYQLDLAQPPSRAAARAGR